MHGVLFPRSLIDEVCNFYFRFGKSSMPPSPPQAKSEPEKGDEESSRAVQSPGSS